MKIISGFASEKEKKPTRKKKKGENTPVYSAKMEDHTSERASEK